MVEELQRTVPDYLMNTNSSQANRDAIADANRYENMPRIIKEPLRTDAHSLDNSQIDLTDMSGEELISIEDTYRETASACRKSIEEQAPVAGRGNKSMTIIEEEEYEESEILG